MKKPFVSLTLSLALGLALVVLFFTSALHAHEESQTVKGNTVPVTQIPFELNGVETASLFEQATKKSVTSYDYILYSWVECKVKWNESCFGTVELSAPAGWQVCKILYNVTARNNSTTLESDAKSWYENDPQIPDRFRAYDLRVGARGSLFIFDQWGSHIKLERVGIRIIPASVNNEGRFQAGCDMPLRNT